MGEMEGSEDSLIAVTGCFNELQTRIREPFGSRSVAGMSSERGLTHELTWWVLPSDSSGRREKLKSIDLGSQRCDHTESTDPVNARWPEWTGEGGAG